MCWFKCILVTLTQTAACWRQRLKVLHLDFHYFYFERTKEIFLILTLCVFLLKVFFFRRILILVKHSAGRLLCITCDGSIYRSSLMFIHTAPPCCLKKQCFTAIFSYVETLVTLILHRVNRDVTSNYRSLGCYNLIFPMVQFMVVFWKPVLQLASNTVLAA